MNRSAAYELESMKSELRSIINELEKVSQGVRSEFKGIGNETCTECINKVINQYRTVLRKLENMDTSKVTESFAQAHSSGEGAHG